MLPVPNHPAIALGLEHRHAIAPRFVLIGALDHLHHLRDDLVFGAIRLAPEHAVGAGGDARAHGEVAAPTAHDLDGERAAMRGADATSARAPASEPLPPMTTRPVMRCSSNGLRAAAWPSAWGTSGYGRYRAGCRLPSHISRSRVHAPGASPPEVRMAMRAMPLTGRRSRPLRLACRWADNRARWARRCGSWGSTCRSPARGRRARYAR